MLLLFGLVLPVAVFAVLFKKRELIKEDDEATIRLYGFITNGLRKDWYFWQLVTRLSC